MAESYYKAYKSEVDMRAFLAVVTKVLANPETDEFPELDTENDYVPKYTDKDGEKTTPQFYEVNGRKVDVSFLGAIKWNANFPIQNPNWAFPFDKNNLTYPIPGETVVIINMAGQYYYLPFSKTIYPNYRRYYPVFKGAQPVDAENSQKTEKTTDYGKARKTGRVKIKTQQSNPGSTSEELVDIRTKYLKPTKGDTIITGRAGNSIRLSEYYKSEEITPSIIISNGQSENALQERIGFLTEENINNDGSSLYMTSLDMNVGFQPTVEKTKDAFKNYPSELTGNQIYLNSDRVILSAKAREFIIFGKSNTGVLTDGNFTVDAKGEIHLFNEQNITIESKGNGGNEILLRSDNGKIFIGNNTKQQYPAQTDVQQMVLGNELVKILERLIYAICRLNFMTPSGATTDPSPASQDIAFMNINAGGPFPANDTTWQPPPGFFGTPMNTDEFVSIVRDLKSILSQNNYVSK